MCSCCGEERPSEVKLATAKVLVSCTGSVLSSPQLPLGECPGTYLPSKAAPRFGFKGAVSVCDRSARHAVFVEEPVHAAAGRGPGRPRRRRRLHLHAGVSSQRRYARNGETSTAKVIQFGSFFVFFPSSHTNLRVQSCRRRPPRCHFRSPRRSLPVFSAAFLRSHPYCVC